MSQYNVILVLFGLVFIFFAIRRSARVSERNVLMQLTREVFDGYKSLEKNLEQETNNEELVFYYNQCTDTLIHLGLFLKEMHNVELSVLRVVVPEYDAKLTSMESNIKYTRERQEEDRMMEFEREYETSLSICRREGELEFPGSPKCNCWLCR